MQHAGLLEQIKGLEAENSDLNERLHNFKNQLNSAKSEADSKQESVKNLE